eukprot:15469821-Alexandrium_andersonii.AAC.1
MLDLATSRMPARRALLLYREGSRITSARATQGARSPDCSPALRYSQHARSREQLHAHQTLWLKLAD